MSDYKNIAKKLLSLIGYLVIACLFAWFIIYKQTFDSIGHNETAPLKGFVRLTSGRDKNLTDYLNKPLLINFWTVFCESCIKEMPAIENFSKNHKEINVLSICIDCGKEKTEEITKKLAITHNVAYGDFSMANRWKASLLPTIYIINRSGSIVYNATGQIDNKKIEDILKNFK